MRGQGARADSRFATTVAAVALALLTLAGPASAATITQKNSAEPALVARINAVRADNHLPALTVSSPLTKAATDHANNMAVKAYFRHEFRKNGKWIAFATWIRWYWPGPGYTTWSAGENLAWGAPALSPAHTVTAWMNSPGHRANLLGAWTSVGVAIVHVLTPGGFFNSHNEVTIVAAEFGRRT